MQDVVGGDAGIKTEAKVTARNVSPDTVPTVTIDRTLDVRLAQDVYLNLDAGSVASIRREGDD